MDDVPIARLLASSLRLAVDQMHERLAVAGFDDLRPIHGYVLNAADGVGVTASALATVLGITKQAVAKVVQELVALDYVERQVAPGDARRRPITLTPRGHAALEASARIQREIEQEWASAVGERRLATTRAALEGVLAAARAEGRTVSLRPTW
ncbi:MAG TPA: MarR family transcriptional regulator [Phycicoccus sp.]|nr:MarR family transcriptional regulator [Phycicoccus sp.]